VGLLPPSRLLASAACQEVNLNPKTARTIADNRQRGERGVDEAWGRDMITHETVSSFWPCDLELFRVRELRSTERNRTFVLERQTLSSHYRRPGSHYLQCSAGLKPEKWSHIIRACTKAHFLVHCIVTHLFVFVPFRYTTQWNCKWPTTAPPTTRRST
jgi:hypothetical protein